MTTPQQRGRRGVAWAVIGGIVLLAGIATVIIGAIAGPGGNTIPSVDASSPATPAPTTSAPSVSADSVVDESAGAQGWTPEPITRDAATYIRSALAAASTFDTALATRNEWLTYLDGWFTPDTRYPDDQRADRMRAAQLELRQGVVLPQETWDSLAARGSRVEASTSGDVSINQVPEDATGEMRIGTADVEMVFTQTDGAGGTSSYTETVRVSVQVLCGASSVPTPNSAQRAGDCKVVRYFTEPAED